MWSACSWVSRMASSSSGSTPADFILSRSLAALNPASTSRTVSPALTMVAFPPLPLPNTQNCIMRGI